MGAPCIHSSSIGRTSSRSRGGSLALPLLDTGLQHVGGHTRESCLSGSILRSNCRCLNIFSIPLEPLTAIAGAETCSGDLPLLLFRGLFSGYTFLGSFISLICLMKPIFGF